MEDLWAVTSPPESPKWPPGNHFVLDYGGFHTCSAFGINIPICQVWNSFLKKCEYSCVSMENNKMAPRQTFWIALTWFLGLFSISSHRQPLSTPLKWFERKFNGYVIAGVSKMITGQPVWIQSCQFLNVFSIWYWYTHIPSMRLISNKMLIKFCVNRKKKKGRRAAILNLMDQLLNFFSILGQWQPLCRILKRFDKK